MKVPLLDLRKQYENIREEIMKVTEEVFTSQQFILGPKLEEFEKLIASYCGCEFAVGVSSGTDALLVSLMSAGVGEGDWVATSPYTFFATGGSIARVGARPVFVDIDERTYNMDPRGLEATLARMRGEQKDRLRAVMPVHLYGQCTDMEAILDLARYLFRHQSDPDLRSRQATRSFESAKHGSRGSVRHERGLRRALCRSQARAAAASARFASW